MIDLGLSAGKPVWFCISLSHAINRELEHAEPICLDTSSWRCQEGAGDAPGRRWWEHPAAEGLSPPQPQPCSCLPLVTHQLWAVGAAGGSCALSMGPSCHSRDLWSCPSHLLQSHWGNDPRASARCCSSTNFPRPCAPTRMKNQVRFAMASVALPPHPCLKTLPAARDVLSFIAIVIRCKYLGLVGF